MLLHLLLASPFAAAILLALVPGKAPRLAQALSVLLSAVIAVLAICLLVSFPDAPLATAPLTWFALPGTHAMVQYALYADGFSTWMVLLSSLLTLCALWLGNSCAGPRFKGYALLVLLLEGALFGCFLASDAVLFFLFFELLVPPAALLIAVYGGVGRKRAALLFAIFTLAGSVPMAVALWAIAAWTGVTSGAMIGEALMGIPAAKVTVMFFAFALAFAVKTPLFPLHGWQAESYTEAPGPVTALLSGAMAKVGVFGFLRWTLPLFPEASVEHSQLFVWLGVITVIFGALAALRQNDIKRVLTFSSLGHLGLAIVGAFTLQEGAILGVVLLMVAHGFSTGALFFLAHIGENWRNSRLLSSFGGMSSQSPRFALLFMVGCLAAIAVPGSLGFVGEFLILQGAWQSYGILVALLAGLGMILSAAYTLRVVQAMLFGKAPSSTIHDAGHGHATPEFEPGPELRLREILAIAPLLVLLFVFGLLPGSILHSVQNTMGKAPVIVATDHAETNAHE